MRLFTGLSRVWWQCKAMPEVTYGLWDEALEAIIIMQLARMVVGFVEPDPVSLVDSPD